MWFLNIHLLDNRPFNYTVKKGVNSIGRMPDNDIYIPDDNISRYHAEIHYNEENNKLFIKDLDSTNGTYVNGTDIDEILYLRHEDKIQLGSCQIVANQLEHSESPDEIELIISSYAQESIIESVEVFAQLLKDIGDQVINTHELNLAFAEVANVIKRIINVDQCQIILLDEIEKLRKYGISLESINEVIEKNNAFIIPIMDQAKALNEDTTPQKPFTFLLVPVSSNDKVVALISASKSMVAERPFDQRDLQLVVAISHLISITIERKRVESKLLYNAFHDPLTKLPNRLLFLDRIRVSLAKIKRDPNYMFAILFIDIDNFKDINDSLGHKIGDQFLIELSKRLKENIREVDTVGRFGMVARFGGDEFAIFLDGINEESDAAFVAQRLQELIKQPIFLEGKELTATLSIGVTVSATKYKHPEDMIRDADIAMYRAKELGRNRIEVYDTGLKKRVTDRLNIVNSLRKAIDQNEFLIYYQPIISLRTGRIVGLEALLRWASPTQGFLTPDKFIMVCDTTGLTSQIDYWVAMNACQQMVKWQTQFPCAPPLYLSINLSAKQINNPRLIEEVNCVFNETGIDPNTLWFEITEKTSAGNEEATLEMLRELHHKGVRLSLDDFGTGYSAYIYLVNCPIDAIKIDKSFIAGIGKNPESSKIIESVKSLANQLSISIVAEGVEERDQMDFLVELECEYAQGFYFSKALPPDEITSLLSTSKSWK
jgi:diguanylate cyclase (GGDEF)-like protein